MQKTCLKCDHLNPTATGAELEACPSCGAIYSRVEAAMAGDAPPRAAPNLWSTQPPSRPRARGQNDEDNGLEVFAERLRRKSLYPTFRSLVRLVYVLWLALAALSLVTGLGALFFSSGVARILAPIFGLFFALFFYFIGKICSEMSLMLADLSDAAVRIAARDER